MLAATERRARIQDLLSRFDGDDSLRRLFWEVLAYDRVGRRIDWQPSSQAVAKAVAEAPTLLSEAGDGGGFHVIYVRLASADLSRARERAVAGHLLRGGHPHGLFVFSDRDQDAWHFVNARGGEDAPPRRRTLRRLSVAGPGRQHMAAGRLARIARGALEEQTGKPLAEMSPLEIQALHDDAFDVEALTRDFYEGYRTVFEALKRALDAQAGDERWAHQYALHFLNRCMFVYFVQQKQWLGGDPAFMRSFWRAYQEAGGPRDAFVSHWLRVLFFEGLGASEARRQHAHYPPRIQQALREAPRLGGGLFQPGDLDEKRRQYAAAVTDERFRHIFEFLERYDFTLAEDRPLDQEVAVDPVMIGKVYESLVHAGSEAGERAEAGIFYTPRTEIDLMCRLSLVDYLTNHLGAGCKDTIYAVVFALGPEEKRRADQRCARAGLWPCLHRLLKQVTVVDPACGSGAFLVGMLHVLDDLLRRAGAQTGAGEPAYERRQRIIGRSLYGVDVMGWATDAARLRLRLSLVACADVPPEERRAALRLPDVAFKIRTGDALVPDAGGPAPFVWEAAFSEIFSGEEPGFDVVIGNPPYVRQEHIADPALAREAVTTQNKKQYKEKLASVAQEAFLAFFRPGKAGKKTGTDIDKKSDLYIYFYFCALRLLNARGTFCFLTSNTWLDVGYGRVLQEFLLRHAHVKLVIDNREHRSFAEADVNTVVTLFSAPDDTESWALGQTARFVMLKTPFEDALRGDLWAGIERVEGRQSTPACRVFAAPQSALLQSGARAAHATNGQAKAGVVAASSVKYEGDKWGGKYLRAPAIYWKIIERAGDKLCRLGDVASVRRGFTTGANRFFYLTEEDVAKWQIEERFRAPLLKTPRETKRVILDDCGFEYQVFLCGQPKERLQGTQALAYIEWGEQEGFHERPTFAGRTRWWSLCDHQAPALVSPCSVSDLYRAYVNDCQVRVDKRLYEVRPMNGWVHPLAASLNATLTSLFLELLTRAGLGEGLLDMTVYELEDCPVVHPRLLEGVRLEDREIKSYRQELSDERRHRLDERVAGAFGLSRSEQRDVRQAVCDLISKRTAKTKSAG